MPSPKVIAAFVLLLMATLLAAGNLWFTAARSTIPLALDAIVLSKEIREEKHPPKDSVYLLRLDNHREMHVDRAVSDALSAGEQIHKDAWSHELRHDRGVLDLHWSADYRGMRWVMPGALLVMAALAVVAIGPRKETNASAKRR